MGTKKVSKTFSREQFGDFQTPSELVDLVLAALYRDGRSWSRALEPTCGMGSFIKGLFSVKNPPREIQAMELQPEYVEKARAVAKLCSGFRVQVHHLDLFRHNLSELRWQECGPLLVVGNPPWVTNAALGALGSANLPTKNNFKNLRGLEARTGEANFDIAEYIWLKLIRELAWCRPTIALLCKTQVARNVLRFANKTGLPLSNAAIYRIDAQKSFGAAVDACLFSVDIGSAESNYEAAVFEDLLSTKPVSRMGIANGTLVSNSSSYEKLKFLDGECGFTWRQGLKHDLSSVMELREVEGSLANGLGENVDVEQQYVYPLLKSSDLQPASSQTPRFHVIVPQQSLADDTKKLKEQAPKLWTYLSTHLEKFDARKSTIYENRSPFSIFGIGPYSFSEYKVAVSGLYKKINFKVVPPWNGKPVMLDDTCYFIPCVSAEQACVLACLLNQPACIEFIHSLVFMDSKRPVTKKVLRRINVNALAFSLERAELLGLISKQLEVIGESLSGRTIDLESHLAAQSASGSAPPQYQLAM